ncbi:Ribonuclease BN [Candidatus Bilamarchaeum dharawalense]|uniref:Ribonuclease BN n=1 Tax=Candidatus Bilamarchaeum dharawalense TaxID=2885759 RepID=A0A5E4LRB6_9ARCH|nr:Ribonuclease BN [Candidatus Bilamarchaeum dharawalense]
MELIFLGTGGGRVNLIKQVRGTGGFRINSRSANIHVDPGPGALLHSIKNRQDPLELDCVIVTHNHTDHVNDAGVMIEGMTRYSLKKRGIVIGSAITINGSEDRDRGLTRWHQSKASEVYAAKFGEKKKFATEKGSFDIEIFGLKHDEPSTFGFKLTIDNVVVGYITDTELMEDLGKNFSGCDVLIINCIKPEHDEYEGHLKTEDVIEIVKEAKPKTCVISHMGIKMLRAGPNLEAERIEKGSGIRTVAAKDGMKLVF